METKVKKQSAKSIENAEIAEMKKLVAEMQSEIVRLKDIEARGERKKQMITVRRESMEDLGARLYKEKATQEQIVDAFTNAYVERHKTPDTAFLAKRIAIYMEIGRKRVKYWEKQEKQAQIESK